MTDRLLVGFDTETFLISETEPFPEVVCLSYDLGDGAPGLVGQADDPSTTRPQSEVGETLGDHWRALIRDPGVELVGHNGAGYDLPVLTRAFPDTLPDVFRALDEGRIKDTLLTEQLKGIDDGTFRARRNMKGGYSLERLSGDRLGRRLDKSEDGWRLRYGELANTPTQLWPERASAYAKMDAVSTREVYLSQCSSGYQPPDQILQVRSMFAHALMRRHGIVCDSTEVDKLERSLHFRRAEAAEVLNAAGLLKTVGKKNPKTSRNMKAIKELVRKACEQLEIEPELTDGGDVSTSKEALEPLFGVEPALDTLIDYVADGKVQETFLPVVRGGCTHPIHARFNTLVESGRPSCSDPNLYNLPRAPGARECIVARPGYAIVSVDFSVAELRALAQICYSWFGFSQLREAFCAGRDPHTEFAAGLNGWSYAEASALLEAKDPIVKDARQFAKIPNFGFGGGMGARRFQAHAKAARPKSYVLDLEECKRIRGAWLAQWYEMPKYFDVIASITGDFGPKKVTQYGSGRSRHVGDEYSACANTFFQGLIADMAKDAHYRVTRACYVEPRSDLYGARPISFPYDEIVLEAPIDRVHEVAEECSRIMLETQSQWMPDVPPACDAKASLCWAKGAERVAGPDGRLKVWEKVVKVA